MKKQTVEFSPRKAREYAWEGVLLFLGIGLLIYGLSSLNLSSIRLGIFAMLGSGIIHAFRLNSRNESFQSPKKHTHIYDQSPIVEVKKEPTLKTTVEKMPMVIEKSILVDSHH